MLVKIQLTLLIISFLINYFYIYCLRLNIDFSRFLLEKAGISELHYYFCSDIITNNCQLRNSIVVDTATFSGKSSFFLDTHSVSQKASQICISSFWSKLKLSCIFFRVGHILYLESSFGQHLNFLLLYKLHIAFKLHSTVSKCLEVLFISSRKC